MTVKSDAITKLSVCDASVPVAVRAAFRRAWRRSASSRRPGTSSRRPSDTCRSARRSCFRRLQEKAMKKIDLSSSNVGRRRHARVAFDNWAQNIKERGSLREISKKPVFFWHKHLELLLLQLNPSCSRGMTHTHTHTCTHAHPNIWHTNTSTLALTLSLRFTQNVSSNLFQETRQSVSSFLWPSLLSSLCFSSTSFSTLSLSLSLSPSLPLFLSLSFSLSL